MIIPKTLIKEGKHYRIKIKDPMKHVLKGGNYSDYIINKHEDELNCKTIDNDIVKEAIDDMGRFDAILYIMSRRLEVVRVRRVREEECGDLKITLDINLKYGTGPSRNTISTQVYFYYSDLTFCEEVITSDHYFVKNPLKTTDNTIKICHIELNRAKALELIEQLQLFINMEVLTDEEEV